MQFKFDANQEHQVNAIEAVSKLRPDEARKIKCGERHFFGALEVSYKVVTKASELL